MHFRLTCRVSPADDPTVYARVAGWYHSDQLVEHRMGIVWLNEMSLYLV
jgi:hypothetical protein